MAPPSKGFSDIPTVRQVSDKPGAGLASFQVQVVEGPDAPMTFALNATHPRLLLGQSPVCDVRLTDPAISRRHVQLEVEGECARLRDLGSTNGTWVQKIRVHDAVLEAHGAFRIGSTRLELRPAPGAAAEVVAPGTHFGSLHGSSLAVRRLYRVCERLAQTDVPVLIEGETGTGKEVLAEALHSQSPRSQKPFVVFDCTTVASNLVESALFGHERGAFTGAVGTFRGVFEEAHGGTLLLDELGDLELELQAKLLRAIDRKEIKRVGGNTWHKVDVRLLSATRRDLDQLIQRGQFRDDLFYRIAVARIELPPLRDRAGDVRFLACRFWKELGGEGDPPTDVLARWEAQAWPGNVRELHHAVARHLALGDTEDQAATVDAGPRPKGGDELERILSLDLPFSRARELMINTFEGHYVRRVLQKHRGNVSRAAQDSGIARRYFHVLKSRQKL